MSNSLARLRRAGRPKREFRGRGYRRAYAFLVEEFKGRCVYCDQHFMYAGGHKAMHVDHYDPRKKKDRKQDYYNLFLATAHCNISKGEFWPNRKQRTAGIRIINPCEELDFGLHLFEDPNSHRLWGATPTGRWHIRKLDLNAAHLVRERADRSKLRVALTTMFVVAKAPINAPLQAVDDLRQRVDLMIREIPFREPPREYVWI